ncbi:MAG TPA: TetR/AcrR family transcriptional regulator [Acidimicrobiales bacterium]
MVASDTASGSASGSRPASRSASGSAPDALPTRQRLIRTTARLLRKQGYAATGLNQVMSEADAPKGSMYFHFPGGKEELAAAGLEYFNDRVMARMADGLARAGSVKEAVLRFLDDQMTYAARTEYREGCALAAVALDAASDHPGLAGVTRRSFAAWIDLFAEALEAEGQSPAEARQLASLITVTLEGAVVLAKGMQSGEAVAAARDALDRLLSAPSEQAIV